MKYIFTAILLMAACFAKGQVVNIPDSNFKYALLNHNPPIDINNDGEIEVSEALQATLLDLPGNFIPHPITNLTGIEAFTNIETLLFSGSNIQVTALDVSMLQKIKYFNFQGPTLRKLLLGNLDSLTTIGLGGTSIDSLDLRGCKNLANTDVELMQSLVYLDISGLKKITVLGSASRLTTLKANGCSGLTWVSLPTTSEITTLELSGCTNLSNLEINNYGLPSLDLSSCLNLKALNLTMNAAMVNHLNLKNGSQLNRINVVVPATSTLNICADEFEVNSLSNLLANNNPQINNLNISPYCSFFPGGNYNTIKGKARLDLNNNGCDSLDNGMPNVPIKITDSSGNSIIRYTVPSGDYASYPYKGAFTLSPYFPYPYFIINPATTTVSFDTANSLINTKDFCIRPNGTHNDLEITFLPAWPPARPGFDASYTMVYKNRGTTTLSGSVQVNFDNGKMNFTTASPNISSQSTGQLSWNYNNLQPFESRTIYVSFNLLPPPVNNIGDTIIYLAAITPSANDETAFDNSFILPQRIIGSFDPNDKQCLEGSKLDISKIGDYLHYQIRFQNEGTDTAFNIVVADTLNDKLDWNSFELISSSHTVDVKLNNNKAEFIFENIKLPYKAINEPASNGWVAFKIKPTPSVVIGDSLNNKAAIYFDFNKPVITNTATTVVSSASTPVPVKLEYFSVNSSNNTNMLNWKAACSYGSAKFIVERSDNGIHFSSIGNITATSTRCQLPFNFTDNNPVAGKNYYRLKITDADGISFYSKTLVIGINKTGLEIRAIANDIIYLSSNKQQTIQLKLIAADGKLIYANSSVITAGNNHISLPLKNTAAGVYTLIIYTNDFQITTKRIVK